MLSRIILCSPLSFDLSNVSICARRSLQIRLDQPISDPASPREISNGEDTATHISTHIQVLRSEVMRLRNQLDSAQKESKFRGLVVR